MMSGSADSGGHPGDDDREIDRALEREDKKDTEEKKGADDEDKKVKKITVSPYKPAPAAPTVESSRAKFKLAHMRGGFLASVLANLVGGGDGVGRALGVKPLETKLPGEKAGEASDKKSAAGPETAKPVEKPKEEAAKEPIAPVKKEESGHGESKTESKKH